MTKGETESISDLGEIIRDFCEQVTVLMLASGGAVVRMVSPDDSRMMDFRLDYNSLLSQLDSLRAPLILLADACKDAKLRVAFKDGEPDRVFVWEIPEWIPRLR